jgi:hypothetical protein
MEDMLWIEHIINSIPTPPILTISKVDMASFVDPHKVVVKNAC